MLQRFTRLAAAALRVPIAFASIVLEDGRRLEASVGLEPGQAAAEPCFCRELRAARQPLVVGDASADPRYSADPWVAGGVRACAYLGVPLFAHGGALQGVFSAIDVVPRSFDARELAALTDAGQLLSDAVEADARNETLRRAEQRMRCIANSIPARIGYWNRELRCEFANDAHRTLVEATVGEIVGMTMQELQGPELFKLNEPHVRSALAGEAQHFERRLPNPDGTASTVDVQYRPDVDESGAVRGFYVLVTDITAIQTARDAAVKLAAAKTDFLANMSHEIRTPLNGILGMTQLLLNTPLSSEQREFAATAQSSGEHLLGIVDDVLDFSKIESGRLLLESIPFDLDDLLAKSAAAVAPAAQKKGLALRVDVSLSTPRRSGDPTRLRQVLLNLLGNAVKFTSEGSVSVTIAEGADGDEVLFSVRDTGIGITAEQLPQVFDRFTQADSSTSRRFGGSGLGLAICRRLVEMMGGQLSASSEPGSGSRFWFRVPLPAAARAEEQPAATTGGDPGSAALAGLQVLVAEDNSVNQMVVRKMLQRLGCVVTVVENGRAAVESWSSRPFDVVVMDCQMPEMDGFEATRCIRSESPRGADVPIIALTAGALHSDREQALSAGMSDFLTKPLLAKTLEAALHRSGARPAPTA